MLRKINIHESWIVNRGSLAILSAALLILSFPPFNIWILAWIAFVPLFFSLEGQRPSKAFFLSYITGFLFFLGTIYWLIHVTLPGMATVVAYLALYFGLFGLLARFTIHDSRSTALKILLATPALWVTLEWLRSHVLTGFGWNLLGYSQSFNLPIIQIADLFGAYGVSFLIIMLNAVIYITMKNFKQRKDTYIPIILASVILMAASGYGMFRLNNIFTGEKLRVSIVQGNIPQDKKWDENFADIILARYEDLTKRSTMGKDVDLVIWPETSVPGFIRQSDAARSDTIEGEDAGDERALLLRIKKLAVQTQTPLLVGAPSYEKSKEGYTCYNSVFLFLKDGSVAGRYDKLHLVPFGEYVPFKNILFFVHRLAPRPIGDFVAGKDFTVLRFPVERKVKDPSYSWKMKKMVRLAALICFEDIFSGIAGKFAGNNTDFLVNITNDGWFGKSGAAYQHAQASVFRAVENRINVLRAANTGMSCFIDQKGQIISRVSEDGKELFVEGFKICDIILSRTRTFYTTYGDAFAYMCVFFTVFIMIKRFKTLSSGLTVFIMIMAVSLCGCDSNQYQIVTGSDGSLYRFNKKTGELSIIMEDKKVVRLAEAKKSEMIQEGEERPLDQPISWNESRFQTKNLKARLETVWRENKLCYKFSVYPYKSMEKVFTKKKQDYIYSIVKPGFNIELLDKNGFLVKEIKINLWNMNKVTGDDGKEKELVVNSQVDCTKQSYRSIAGYSIKWLLDPDLIEDEKEDFIKSSPIKREGI